MSALEPTVRVRDESTLRPLATLALQRTGKPEAGAQLRAQVDDLTTDTTRLRALDVRDAVVLHSALPFGEHVFLSARAAAETFYTQPERSYLGAGLTFDAVSARAFACLPTSSWRPSGSSVAPPRASRARRRAVRQRQERSLTTGSSEWVLRTARVSSTRRR